MVTAPSHTYLHSGSCHVWQAWVRHVDRVRPLELHGLTGAGVFVAAGATVLHEGMGLFFRPTPYGFRQVVQHVSKHVAFGIN